MRWAMMLSGVVAAVVLGAPPKQLPGAGPLEGVWRGKVIEANAGRDVSVELTIRGNKMLGVAGGEPQGGGTFTLTGDAKGSMDMIGTDGTQRGHKYAGIYELDGENLKWCLSTNVKRRPKEMASKNGNYLLVLRKVGGGGAKSPGSSDR